MFRASRKRLPTQGEIQHPALQVKEYSEEESEKMWLKAGKLGAEIREEIAKLVKPGASVWEICKKADELIWENEARPAFPVNISINDVAAHYTSPIGDELVIPDRGVVKIDLGVSIDGFLSDTATSVDLDGTYKELVETTKFALEEAIPFMKPGANTGAIGGIIEKAITSRGFIPVKELRGHQVERYAVHAAKGVPNVHVEKGDTIEVGEIFAVEPFALTGIGGLQEDYSRVNIFRVLPFRVAVRSQAAKKILHIATHEFEGLPFAERWLEKHQLSSGEIKIGIHELRRVGALQEYHVLRASDKNAVISQHEHTMLIKEDGPVVTTKI